MNETTKPEQVTPETTVVAEPQGGPGTPGAGQQEEPTKHKQVTIRWNGHEEEVDEGIADLILALWACGIDTVMSCQETEPGVAWIEFPTVEDALKFVNRVAGRPPKKDVPLQDTLYGRITECGSESDWMFNAHAADWAEKCEVWDWDHTVDIAQADFDFAISVWLPTEDIPLILATLTGSNAPPTGRAPVRHGRKEDATKQP